MIRICGRSLASLAILGLSACGSTEPSLRAISLSPDHLALLVHMSERLVARNQSGDELGGQSVAWTTSAPAVATVSATGLVAAAGAGTATITATANGSNASATVTVTELDFATVVAGGAHTCALTTSASAYCWGRGESGQLGVAAPATLCALDGGDLPCSGIPVAVQGGLSFTRLAAGGTHTCGLTGDGSAYCWGFNANGQLGDNSATTRFAPVAVSTALKFASLTAGASHTCGLTAAGIAYCWGYNNKGQLGDGSTTDRRTPVAVTGGLAFQMLTGGGFSIGHTCGVTPAGAGYCWGDNTTGQLGIGSVDFTAHSAPIALAGGLVFSALSAGLNDHTCGVTGAGAAYCWGNNNFGALGDGTTTARSSPVLVLGGLSFAQIASGGFVGHTCGLTLGGAAYCWGDNEVGALGDGTNVDRLVPRAVLGDISFTSLDAGYRHTCGRSSAGIVYCWGSGRAGQNGTGDFSILTSPAMVLGQP